MNDSIDAKYPSATYKLDLFTREFEAVRHLSGDFAEFGVYHGNGTRELASLDRGRLAWAFDTFEGMPLADYNGPEDDQDPPGKWKPEAPPEVTLSGIGNVRVVKGRFAETLCEVPADVRFILCHLDCDWYNSYTQVLTWLEEHLTPGAILLLDDYNSCPGCNRAVDEWVASMGPRVEFDGRQKIVWQG